MNEEKICLNKLYFRTVPIAFCVRKSVGKPKNLTF